MASSSGRVTAPARYDRLLEGEESEHRFRQMLDALPGAVYMTDAEGRVTYFNPACIELSGRVPELGTDRWCVSWKLYRPDGTPLPHEECPMAVALKEGRAVRGEEILAERPDGTRVWLAPYPTPLVDEAGRLLGGINMLVDVADLRRGREALALLGAIVESSDDAIISKDLNGVITSWNRGAECLFGYTADEAVGRSISILIPPERLDEEARILERLRRGERVDHFETVRVRKDGSRLDISLTISPLKDAAGRIVGASKVARNITERKQAEEALRQADRRKDEFLATLAHELRNPLAPIRTAAEVLKLVGPPDATLQWVREVIERQSQHLTRLVDDLLDVSRITQGKVVLARMPLDLATIVHRAVETSRPLLDACRHRLTVAIPPQSVRLEGDLMRLVQVVSNLLNNAAKFTDEGGSIHLEAAYEDGEAVIRVRDDGIGIPADLLPRVFDLFTQADRSLDRSQGGLGIGLTLVRRLVELHGGRVEARSEGPGLGSEFTVRLPATGSAAASAAETPTSVGIRPASRPLRVLVVEDNVDAAEMMSLLLERLGHEVRTAHSGTEAMRAAREFEPQAVLCDIGLPGMNGYELAARLREEPALDRTTLIALTGYGQENARDRARNAGFDYHLVKPVEPREIEAILNPLPASERLS